MKGCEIVKVEGPIGDTKVTCSRKPSTEVTCATKGLLTNVRRSSSLLVIALALCSQVILSKNSLGERSLAMGGQT